MRILLVEDDERIAAALTGVLEESGYSVVAWEDGESAYLDARLNPYDLVVLDLMLPDMDGIEIARKLRSAGKTVPILMLTARTTEQDVITGLDAGADDYLTKPFRLGEFLARVRSLLRRDSIIRSRVMEIDDLVVDTGARRVFRAGHEIELSAREYALLEYLAFHAGKNLTRDQLREHVWSETEILSNVVDVYIGYLRQKVDAPFGKPLIRTVRGVGYSLAAP